MVEAGTKKLAHKIICLALLIFCLFIFTRESTRMLLASSPMSQEGIKPPVISVAAQEGAPLHIISTSIESTDPQDFRLQMIIQNQSGKEIRAYTIASEIATYKTQNGRADFLNLRQKANFWQPTVIKAVEFRATANDPLLNVKLIVDFVEFSDGTTWGPDTHKSSDILTGQRAGARLEAQRLRQLLRSKGRIAVVTDVQKVDAGDLDALAGSGRSSQWMAGFRSGVSAVRSRLKQALQFNSEVNMESELDNPFDTSKESPR